MFGHIQKACAVALFLAILALGTWTRFQGITERGVFAHDSADVWGRTCARVEGREYHEVARFQPLPDYLYSFGMLVFGKRDYAPMVVNASFDVANMALLFLLSRRLLRSVWAALACMGLYAVMWGAVGLSRELMTHPPAAFFVMLAFWAFLRYAEEVGREVDAHPLRWLAVSGGFAGMALASHLSVQFLCIAFVLLIAMRMAALEEATLWEKGCRFLLQAAVFSVCVFSVILLLMCTETATRGPKAFFGEMRTLSDLHATEKWILERHYAPRVAAIKIRPTISSGTLDHLTLGTESLVNGQPALDRLDSYWYGDNPYALAFFINIPLMVVLAARRRKEAFNGYALYILVIGLVFGLNACYTAYYVQHYRYLLPVMPFLIINLFFWVLLLAREFLPRRWELPIVILVALAGFWGQKIALPGNPAILEPTPCRQIANALEGKATGPMSRVLMAHPVYRFGTGELGWTLGIVYLRNSVVVPFPSAKNLADPKYSFNNRQIRYIFTDLSGIDGILNREEIRGNPVLLQKVRDYLSPLRLREIGRVTVKNHEGIVYEIAPQ